MNWYYTPDGNNPQLTILPEMIRETGDVLTPSQVLVDRQDWQRLIDAGWYREYREVAYPYMAGYLDPVIQVHPDDGFLVAFVGAGVRQTLSQVLAQKIAEVERQIPVYSGSEIEAEPQKGSEVRDFTTWARRVTAELVVISDWDTLAGYNTVAPKPLGLANAEVANTLALQEEKILGNDNVRVGLGHGMPEPNRAALETHLSSLYSIIGGVDSIPPSPPKQFRQDVYVTDEKDAVLKIERKYFTDGAWSGWGWQATLNVKYVDPSFWMADYLPNGTYLSTPAFVEQSPGVWVCPQDLNNWAGQQDQREHLLVLCEGHITNEISDQVLLQLGVDSIVTPVRYAGSVGAPL